MDFRIGARMRVFLTALRSEEFYKPARLLFVACWLATFVLSFWGNGSPGWATPILILHIFLWVKNVEFLTRKLQAPVEILILSFLFLLTVDKLCLPLLYQTPGPWGRLLQLMLVAFLVLSASLILTKNSQHPKRTLILALMLFYLGVNVLQGAGPATRFFVQAILFIILLRKTAWLEELTKAECWMYVFVVWLLFDFTSSQMPVPAIIAAKHVFVWREFPLFLFLMFKMYLLAVLVKIPVVLVHNFASLSRKLTIVGYFQSTFPQIIQLLTLAVLFYFLIAGWQAEKVRVALLSVMESIAAGQGPPGVQHAEFSRDSTDTFEMPGFEPITLAANLPDQGVLAVKRTRLLGTQPVQLEKAYFIYSTLHEDAPALVSLVRLDSTFLRQVSENTAVLVGTDLLAYPFVPRKFESVLYKLDFLSDDNNIRIFPLGLIPGSDELEAIVPIRQVEYGASSWLTELELPDEFRFTVGRVITPLHDASTKAEGYFAFDVMLYPGFVNYSPTLLYYIFILWATYFSINVLVVRRMVKFGHQINRMIVQKFSQLKTGIREISSGNLDYKLHIEGKDEFVELAERFNQMGDKLKQAIMEAREKERLTQELTIARKVQLDLLPRSLPQAAGYEIAATFQTATEVGGDFYDMLRLSEHLYLFTIGDVSGKGTSAAFYMAQCISLIRYSQQFTHDPVEIVRRLNAYFSDPMIDQQVFVTAIVGTLDVKKHHISFVRAGHTPPVYIPGSNDEQLRELQQSGLGLGIARGGDAFAKNLKSVEVDLRANDKVLFYTDGLTEAAIEDRNGEKTTKYRNRRFYGEERLMQVLSQHRDEGAPELMETLRDHIERFYDGQPPCDDYTMLLIQRASG